MALPKAVQEAGKRSEDALKKAQEDKTEKPVVKPEDALVTKPEDLPPATPDYKKLYEEADQRFKVLQGKYNAEVKAEVHELSEKNQSLQSNISEMQNQINALQEQLSNKQLLGEQSEHLENLRRDRGDEDDFVLALSSQQKTIENQNQMITKLNQVIDGLQGKMSGVETSAKKAEQERISKADKEFLGALTEKVKNWEKINELPQWIDWLRQEDEATGIVRQELLNRARDRYDAERVARFFTDFIKATATKKPNAFDQNIGDLADISGGGGSQDTGKKIWTRKEISDFYSARVKGDVSDEDYRLGEADILAAHSEGRIR